MPWFRVMDTEKCKPENMYQKNLALEYRFGTQKLKTYTMVDVTSTYIYLV